jgi:hypothetical protein
MLFMEENLTSFAPFLYFKAGLEFVCEFGLVTEFLENAS